MKLLLISTSLIFASSLGFASYDDYDYDKAPSIIADRIPKADEIVDEPSIGVVKQIDGLLEAICTLDDNQFKLQVLREAAFYIQMEGTDVTKEEVINSLPPTITKIIYGREA